MEKLMYHTLAQDQSLWRALLSSKVALVFVVTFFCAFLSHSFAQVQDVTPPILTDFSFTPVTIDTSADDASVTMSFSATDNLSGVTRVQTSFLSPSGAQIRVALTGFPLPATSVNGTADATFQQFSEAGTWTVYQVYVNDAAGNSRLYTTTELAQLGFPTELVVVGAEEDVTPPVITITATPQTLWPPNGKMVPVSVSGTIKDTESGVNTSTAAYAVTDEYGLIQPSGQITTLDATNGSYAFRIQLQASRNGNDKDGRQYTITISAQDNEGNQGSNSTIVTVPLRG
jgi:hypothetical protein